MHKCHSMGLENSAKTYFLTGGGQRNDLDLTVRYSHYRDTFRVKKVRPVDIIDIRCQTSISDFPRASLTTMGHSPCSLSLPAPSQDFSSRCAFLCPLSTPTTTWSSPPAARTRRRLGSLSRGPAASAGRRRTTYSASATTRWVILSFHYIRPTQ